MTTRIALVTDSTSNIPLDLAAERNIHIAPLYVIWGEESYKDEVELTAQELFKRMSKANDLPKTSQVSPQDFATMFEAARAAEGADEVVCPVISGKLSGTYSSAIQAQKMVDFPVHVIDTSQTSWALGFPVLAGAEARDAGATADEIVQTIKDSATRNHLVFTVETLDYMRRGGRIGNASWLLGTALNIKPLLEVRDGMVTPAEKVRTRKRAIQHLLKMAESRVGTHGVARLGVIHGGVEEEAQGVLDQATSHFNPPETYLTYAASVLGVHLGPGTLGIIVEQSV